MWEFPFPLSDHTGSGPGLPSEAPCPNRLYKQGEWDHLVNKASACILPMLSRERSLERLETLLDSSLLLSWHTFTYPELASLRGPAKTGRVTCMLRMGQAPWNGQPTEKRRQ